MAWALLGCTHPQCASKKKVAKADGYQSGGLKDHRQRDLCGHGHWPSREAAGGVEKVPGLAAGNVPSKLRARGGAPVELDWPLCSGVYAGRRSEVPAGVAPESHHPED
ncbi:hypothetical protein NDU88_003779 [Pleurodeles waltl]|uniref:Uncharacterized protein n=1 Tax=Pleurodeles waltl TaxID=8319 RepID=A0AAV7UDH4_PLEWA|nr:hypothetical protein NDU88_003779 [Pleurodeles waltl]